MTDEVRETQKVTSFDVLAAQPRLGSVAEGRGYAIQTYICDELPELQRIAIVQRGRPNKRVVYGTRYLVGGLPVTMPPGLDRTLAAQAIAEAINRFRADPGAPKQWTPSTVAFGKKMILVLDLDGVVHRYSKGWQDGTLYDPPTPGFFDWASRVSEKFALVIYSSRSGTEEGRAAMEAWMNHHMAEWNGPPIEFQYAAEKPPAWLTIDDRCIRFDGDWSSGDLRLSSLLAYRPWNTPRKD